MACPLRTSAVIMTAIGYTRSSEEQGPRDLVRNAVATERAGFSFAMILPQVRSAKKRAA